MAITHPIRTSDLYWTGLSYRSIQLDHFSQFFHNLFLDAVPLFFFFFLYIDIFDIKIFKVKKFTYSPRNPKKRSEIENPKRWPR